MGACDLTFNRIVIQNQKSDSDHADNDWLHVAWVVGGPDNPQTIQQTLPLLNAQDSPNLHSGDVIKAGFVGGFPTFKHALTGLDFVTGRGPLVASMTVVLLTAEAAVRQDVVLYWNPS